MISFRKSISLDGMWRFSIDPSRVGEKDNWNSAEFEDRDWSQIDVPSVWEACGYVDYDGAAWYRKRFQLDSDFAGKCIYLEFAAVDYQARVWLNGKFVGEHEGGYTPFKFDITEVVNIGGDNCLAVRVFDPDPKDREFPPVEILDGKQGWESFPSPPSEYLRVGGIWQSVRVIGFPNVGRIEYAAVRRTKRSDGLTEIQVKLEGRKHKPGATANSSSKLSGVIVIKVVPYNFKGKAQTESFNVPVAPDGETEAILNFKLNNVREWSPSKPNLYSAKLTLQLEGKDVDEYDLRFGMREFSISNGKFFLNGSPLFLKGALVQGFYPSTIYVAPTGEYVKREVALAKSAGLNLLRLHIKIFEPIYLDIADELGMLLWVELPVIAPKKLTPKFNERALRELREMIKRDTNHPSILMWGVFNELGAALPPSAAEYNSSLSQLVAEIKKLDDTRPVCQDSWVEQPKFGDFADGHWYYEIPRQTQELEKRVQGVRRQPFIVSEFGGWGLPDFNLSDKSINRPFLKDSEEIKGFLQKFPAFSRAFTSFEKYVAETQELQGEALAQQIKLFRTSDKIAGYVLTELYDVPCEYNGILDYFRNRKAAYDYVGKSNQKVFIVFPNIRNVLTEKSTMFPLTIVNDTDKLLHSVVLSHSLIAETNETNVRKESEPKQKSNIELPQGKSTKIELPLDLGEVSSFKHIKLRVELDFPATVENPVTESIDIFAISKKWVSQPNKHVCLLGEGGKIADIFEELKVNFERPENDLTGNLQDFDAVMVAGQVGKTVPKNTEILLQKYVRAGGRVVVLAQSTKFSLFSSDYIVAPPPEPWLTPFTFAPPNDLMKGFKPGLLGFELVGLYPKYVLTELPDDHEALCCVNVAAQPRRFMGVSLARKTIGKGELVLCQFDLSDRSNPMTLLMARNLLVH